MPPVAPNGLGPLPIPAPARVRLVFAGDVPAFLVDLSLGTEAQGEAYRLVALTFDRLPAVGTMIEHALDRLAQVALSMYPHWYGEALAFDQVEGSEFAFEARFAARLEGAGPLGRAVSPAWVKASRRLCRAGRAPCPRGFSTSVQAAQLALAIDPAPLLIALLFRGQAPPPPGALLGLARTAEWLAAETGARVLVVVPEGLSSSAELDSINFDAVRWSRATAGPGPTRDEGAEVTVSPVIGRPHPLSRGEQCLAKRLERDEGLAGLFRYNVRVATRFDGRYLVDLVWPEGKVVVEVDGYRFHSDPRAFSLDRRRDYELTVSGYLVLRLPHDEVVEDVAMAVEKVRDLVEFRRNNGPNQG